MNRLLRKFYQNREQFIYFPYYLRFLFGPRICGCMDFYKPKIRIYQYKRKIHTRLTTLCKRDNNFSVRHFACCDVTTDRYCNWAKLRRNLPTLNDPRSRKFSSKLSLSHLFLVDRKMVKTASYVNSKIPGATLIPRTPNNRGKSHGNFNKINVQFFDRKTRACNVYDWCSRSTRQINVTSDRRLAI